MADAQRVEIGFEGGQVDLRPPRRRRPQGPAQAAREGRLARPPHRGRRRSPSTSARSPSSASSPASTASASASVELMRPRHLLGAAAAATLAAALWWRKNPSACPYGQRFWVEAPHPIITRERLRQVLRPEPGERLLEIGVGTGYYSLDLAEWVGPERHARALRPAAEVPRPRDARGGRAGAGEPGPDPGRRDRVCPTRTPRSTP